MSVAKSSDWTHNCIGNGCRFVGCENQFTPRRKGVKLTAHTVALLYYGPNTKKETERRNRLPGRRGDTFFSAEGAPLLYFEGLWLDGEHVYIGIDVPEKVLDDVVKSGVPYSRLLHVLKDTTPEESKNKENA